jgi:hypothetical protein
MHIFRFLHATFAENPHFYRPPLASAVAARYKVKVNATHRFVSAMSAKFWFYFFSYLAPLAEGEGR